MVTSQVMEVTPVNVQAFLFFLTSGGEFLFRPGEEANAILKWIRKSHLKLEDINIDALISL